MQRGLTRCSIAIHGVQLRVCIQHRNCKNIVALRRSSTSQPLGGYSTGRYRASCANVQSTSSKTYTQCVIICRLWTRTCETCTVRRNTLRCNPMQGHVRLLWRNARLFMFNSLTRAWKHKIQVHHGHWQYIIIIIIRTSAQTTRITWGCGKGREG